MRTLFASTAVAVLAWATPAAAQVKTSLSGTETKKANGPFLPITFGLRF